MLDLGSNGFYVLTSHYKCMHAHTDTHTGQFSIYYKCMLAHTNSHTGKFSIYYKCMHAEWP